METRRLILLTALGLLAMMLWQEWQRDYGPPPVPATASQAPTAGASPAAPPEDLPREAPAAAPPLRPDAPARAAGARLVARSDVLRLEIGAQGGTLLRASLLRYPVHHDTPDEPFVLLNDAGDDYYVVQSGLLGEGPAPSHDQMFRFTAQRYVMEDGADELVVPLYWRDESGIEVIKTFTLRRGSYQVDIAYQVHNTGAAAWRGRPYTQIQRNDPGRAGRRLIYTYLGGVLSTPENRYEKVDFDDMREQPLALDVADGWVAMLQHYFVTALLPADAGAPYHYYTKTLSGNRFLIGAVAPALEVAPGESARATSRVYAGPKLQAVLETVAPGLELTVDYGTLWILAKPLFVVLEALHDVTGNWGWAIILVTILLKVIFYKLSAAGYRSMANMRRVQPRIMSLRDRYKDDRARLNQAMMQLYKEEKINPFGGCLPILIQIPVFIALYWVLLESVEMRQAPFVLWLQDLSSPDPYWVLPLVMGATMFIQQKLNPAPLDPVQAKVMMIMPFAFTIFFGFFPSGLVLYWVVNNILSIVQQWLITRSIEGKGAGTGD